MKKIVYVTMLAFMKGAVKRPVVIEVSDDDTTNSILNKVYHFGQNDFQPVDGICSVSVQDIIELDGYYHMVGAMGFSEISKAQYNVIMEVAAKVAAQSDNKGNAFHLKFPEALMDAGYQINEYEKPMVQKFTSIKKAYIEAYPHDELGQEINPYACFEELYQKAPEVYEYVGVGDSVLREGVFALWCDFAGRDYNAIYERWLEDIDSEELSSNGKQPKIVQN